MAPMKFYFHSILIGQINEKPNENLPMKTL